MLTRRVKYDILLDDERRTDFLLSKIRTQSRQERLNRFSLIAEMRPFLLEIKMRPKGFKHTEETKRKIGEAHKGINAQRKQDKKLV